MKSANAFALGFLLALASGCAGNRRLQHIESLRHDPLASTNSAAPGTNILAIHLVENQARLTNNNPNGPTLETPPILSDRDFVTWDLTNHTFVITPAAAKRVAQKCYHNELPFVLTCSGERVYLGFFTTMLSSSLKTVPVILTDAIQMTNLPEDMRLRFGGAGIGTSNVTLVITGGYPVDGSDSVADKRSDKRIVDAVEKLFRSRKH